MHSIVESIFEGGRILQVCTLSLFRADVYLACSCVLFGFDLCEFTSVVLDCREVIPRSSGSGVGCMLKHVFLIFLGKCAAMMSRSPDTHCLGEGAKVGLPLCFRQGNYVGLCKLTDERGLDSSGFSACGGTCHSSVMMWGNDWRHSRIEWLLGAEEDVADTLGPRSRRTARCGWAGSLPTSASLQAYQSQAAHWPCRRPFKLFPS